MTEREEKMSGSLILHMCGRCNHSIPPLTEHARMTIHMLAGVPDVRRYCLDCMMDPALAVLLSDVRLNPVKRIEIFMVYR